MGMYEVRRFCSDCGEWRTVRAAQKVERQPNVKCHKHQAQREPLPIGTTRSHSTGYVMVRTVDGWMYEHRAVWQAHYGPIPDGHHVHHINHVRDDNRLENLRLVEGRTHNRHHTQRRHEAGEMNLRGRWKSELDDAEIVARRNRGESFRRIAKDLGASHGTVALHYRRAMEG